MTCASLVHRRLGSNPVGSVDEESSEPPPQRRAIYRSMVHIVVSVSCHAQPNYSTGSYSTGSENQSKSYSAPTKTAFDDTDPPWSQS